MALETLRAAGLSDITIRLSHAGLVRAVLAAAGLTAEEQSAAYDRLLDGDLTIVDEVEARLPQLNAPLRMLFDVEGAGSGYIANLRGSLAGAIPALAAPLDELASTIAVLEARGLRPVIQAVLARSFEYYSGLVMKLDAGGARIAIGGRYDELIGLVGGRSVPASGFALYLGNILNVLPAARAGGAGPRVVVQAEGGDPALLASLYDVAVRLRAAGVHAETVDGMHTAPTHRITCRASSPRFTLARPDASADFERIEDVVAALEHAH
jgi:histidyl-tRNA synthetase